MSRSVLADVDALPFYRLFTPSAQSVRDDQVRLWCSRITRMDEVDLHIVEDIVGAWIDNDTQVESWREYLKFGLDQKLRNGIAGAMVARFGRKRILPTSGVVV